MMELCPDIEVEYPNEIVMNSDAINLLEHLAIMLMWRCFMKTNF